MKLPKQVREQIEEAKRIETELRKQAEPANPDGEIPGEPQGEPQGEPLQAVSGSEEIGTTPPTPPATPEPTPAPVAQPAPPANAVPQRQYDELAHQYRTLQGIHRSLLAQRDELAAHVQKLTGQVQGLAARLQQVSQQPQMPAASALTAEDIEDFDPKLLTIIEKKAQEVAAPLRAQLDNALANVKTLSDTNAQLQQQLAGVANHQASQAEQKFFETLDRLVPSWGALNYDQSFLGWLGQPNPFSAGKTRKQSLDEAVNNFDAPTAANFFKEYLALHPESATPQNAQVVTTPTLQAQVVPQSRSGPDVTSRPKGRTWSHAEIQQFYADVANGKFRTKPKEKQQIERDIFAAQRENRVAA